MKEASDRKGFEADGTWSYPGYVKIAGEDAFRSSDDCDAEDLLLAIADSDSKLEIRELGKLLERLRASGHKTVGEMLGA